MDPTTRLELTLWNLSVNVGAHVGQEGNDIVVGNGLNLVYLSAVKRSVLSNPSCLFARNANNTKLSLCFARKDFNFLPNGVLVLQRKDVAHFFAGVAIYHDETPSARKRKGRVPLWYPTFELPGGPLGVRTLDLGIKSPLLYQLS